MEQKTVVYKDVEGVEQLKIEIDKEHSTDVGRRQIPHNVFHSEVDEPAKWYVHEVVLLRRFYPENLVNAAPNPLADYLVIYRKDEE